EMRPSPRDLRNHRGPSGAGHIRLRSDSHAGRPAAAPVTSALMDETAPGRKDTAPPAPSLVSTGSSRTERWRSPWLISAGLLLILILLPIDVLAHGPLVAADHHIRAAVQARATSPRWLWLSQGRYAPAQLLVDLGNNQVAIPVLAVCALIAVARRQSLRPLL